MIRSHFKYIGLAAVLLSLTAPVFGLSLVAPTSGQQVKEAVKIKLRETDVPDGGYVSVYVGNASEQNFVTSLSAGQGVYDNGLMIFRWNTKAPYYDSANPSVEKYFKDGSYVMRVDVHNAKGVVDDSAKVNIVLANKVPRSNPAPAVRLASSLPFGRVNRYNINTSVDVYDNFGLPIMGGLGIGSYCKMILSVEDVRPDGQILIRYRIGDDTYVSSLGVKSMLYENDRVRPQLYRLVNKYGNVINPNLFTKQKGYTFMDILPVLPHQAVDVGDTWDDSMTFKIEGLTKAISLKGTAKIDSFEWQDGRPCAKIVSDLSGKAKVNFANGNIKGNGTVRAKVTTYFAYNIGKMLHRQITLIVPSTISPEAIAALSDVNSITSAKEIEEEDESLAEAPGAGGLAAGSSKSRESEKEADTTIKGEVRLNAVVRLDVL